MEADTGRISARSWWTWLFCTFVILCSVPGHSSGICPFTEPLLRDLPLTRHDLSTNHALATLLAALLTAWSGRQCDRFGMRKVLLGAFFAFGLTLLLMSALGGLRSCFSRIGDRAYWFTGLLLGFAGLKFLGHNLIPMAARAIYTRWFPGHRSLAVGCSGIIVTSCFGSAAKGLDWGIGHVGWRPVWGLWGIFSWIIVLPVIFFGIHECRAEGDTSSTAPSGDAMRPGSPFFPTVIASWEFWMLSLGIGLQLLIAHGISLHIVDVYRELHPEFRQVFNVLVPVGIVGALSGPLCGYCLDRVSMKYGLLWLYTLQFTLLGSFFLPSERASLGTFVPAMGISWCLYGILLTTAWPRFVAPCHQGRTLGWAYAQSTLGSALGPLVFSASRLKWDSYLPAMRFLMGCVLALALMTLCRVRKEVLAPKA